MTGNPTMMPIVRIAERCLLGLALLCAAALAPAVKAQTTGVVDPPARVGRLADVQGTVWIYDTQAGEWQAAARNRPLTTGDRLSTDRGARAELRVGPTALRLDGGSELEVLQLDDQRVRVQLHNGSLALRLHSRDVARSVEVVTAEGRLQPQRGGHYRVDRNDDVTAATVWSGALHFESDDSALDIAPGQRVEFWRDGPTRYSTGEPERDAFAGWAQSRDRSDERSASTRYVSPEMTGYEDLDRYGRWETAPDYGPLWVPVSVAPDWAPYRYGHWAWVSPWGWTWVDDAPWGFAPFHYGRWVWFRSHWCWAPGSYVARPVYAPALVAWVGGPSVSVSISIGSRSAPPVGWFPLGPREVYVPSYRHSPTYVQNVNITQVTNVTVINQAVQRPPAQYVNRQVFNAVTVVPADVLKERKPVAPAVMRGQEVQQVLQQSSVKHEAPVTAPAPRVLNVAPGAAAVPPPPGRGSEQRRDQEERGHRGNWQRATVPPREANVQAQPPAPVPPAPQAPAAQRPTAPVSPPQPPVATPRSVTPAQPAAVPPQPPTVQVPHAPRGEPQREERPQRDDKPQRGFNAPREVGRDAQREAPRAEPSRPVPPQAQPQPQPQAQPVQQPAPEGRKHVPPRPPEGRGREAAAERQPEPPPSEPRAQERHKEREKDKNEARREQRQQQNN
jgi:hypothetical protein